MSPKARIVRGAAPHEPHHWAQWCGILVVLIYFIRGSVLPWFLPVPFGVWVALNVLCIALAAGVAIVGGGTWRTSWVIVLLAFAASLSQAEQFHTALSRWIGLSLLMLAVGPMTLNPIACAVRAAAWRWVVNGVVALTAIFVLWYVMHLPSPGGRAPFAAFMNQSMILGPIVALGVLISGARAVRSNSRRWGLLAVLGLIPLLASGSRVAALAAGMAGCYLLVRRRPVIGIVLTFAFAVTLGYFVTRGENLAESESVGGSLARKGLTNTRADLWESRIAEFTSSPVFGIGVAMGTESGSAKDADGSIRVEPGSSYLAILAMTGAVGSAAFFSALGWVLYGFVTSRAKAPLDHDILCVTGIFLAVHGVAEGWVLGFGSPLCFLFWLWLGKVGDATAQTVRTGVKRRWSARRRFVTVHPTPAS